MTPTSLRARSLTAAAVADIDAVAISAATGGSDVPAMPYTALRDMVHADPVGATESGGRVAARIVLRVEEPQVFHVVVAGPSAMWSCTYMAAPGGGPGRILKVVDAGGRQWDPQPWVDDWGGGT